MASNTAASRVLILDANPDFVAAATRFLQHLPERSHVSDVVLVDLRLAGVALAQRVKQGNPALAVIGMALFPTPELIDAARLAGIDTVIAKESFAQELPAALAGAAVTA